MIMISQANREKHIPNNTRKDDQYTNCKLTVFSRVYLTNQHPTFWRCILTFQMYWKRYSKFCSKYLHENFFFHLSTIILLADGYGYVVEVKTLWQANINHEASRPIKVHSSRIIHVMLKLHYSIRSAMCWTSSTKKAQRTATVHQQCTVRFLSTKVP